MNFSLGWHNHANYSLKRIVTVLLLSEGSESSAQMPTKLMFGLVFTSPSKIFDAQLTQVPL